MTFIKIILQILRKFTLIQWSQHFKILFLMNISRRHSNISWTSIPQSLRRMRKTNSSILKSFSFIRKKFRNTFKMYIFAYLDSPSKSWKIWYASVFDFAFQSTWSNWLVHPRYSIKLYRFLCFQKTYVGTKSLSSKRRQPEKFICKKQSYLMIFNSWDIIIIFISYHLLSPGLVLRKIGLFPGLIDPKLLKEFVPIPPRPPNWNTGIFRSP